MSWALAEHFVGTAQFSATGVASSTATKSTAVAIGDTILVQCTLGANPASMLGPSLTDSLGNVYTLVTAANGGDLFDATDTQGMQYFWCIVTVAGTPVLTYNPDSGGSVPWQAIIGDHFTGSDATSARRASAGAAQSAPGTGANAVSSGSVGAVSGDLLWGADGAPGDGSGAIAGGTGFTASAVNTLTTMITEFKTAAGAGAASFTASAPDGSSHFMTFGIAISPAGGAPVSTFLSEDGYIPSAPTAPGPFVTVY